MKKQISTGLIQSLSLPLLLLAAGSAFGQSAAISYQGRLTQAGTPASGPFDMQFKLFDTPNVGAGVQRGDTKTLSAVPVANGVFTVRLDFGAAVFDGSPRFLEISVRPGGNPSPYTTLDPRQQVASIPYTIQSLNAATAATALTVASGSAVSSLNNLKDNVTLAAGANVTLTPSGNTLTIASTGGGGGGSGLWSLAGADAYYNAGNVGIGTSTPANKLTVRTPTLGYGIEHTDGDIRLSTFVGRATGYLGTLSNHKLTFFANDNGFPNMTMTLDTAGAVGIGTDSPTAGVRLEVNGPARVTAGGSGGFLQVGTPNGETGLSVLGDSRFDLRFNGSTLKLVAGPGPGPPPPEYGIAITTAGNVGVGTTTPVAKLHAETSQANTSAVYGNATGAGGVGVYGQSTGRAAVYAEGNAMQSRDKGGFVKAMAFINPFLPADQYLVRCYNSQLVGNAASTAPCGIKVTRRDKGEYTVDFGFDVQDRFISVTPAIPVTVAAAPVLGNVLGVPNQIYVNFSVPLSDGSVSADTAFFVFVF